MIIYKLRNNEKGGWLTKMGYFTTKPEVARVYRRLSDLQLSLGDMTVNKNWVVEEIEIKETIVNIRLAADYTKEREERRAAKRAAMLKRYEDEQADTRREQYLLLKKEFEPAQ